MLNMKACPRNQLMKELGNKKIVCFGAGRGLTFFLKNNPDVRGKMKCILDNNQELEGTFLEGYPIYTPESFLKQQPQNFVVFVTAFLHYRDIIEQLDGLTSFDGIDCYIDDWNSSKLENKAVRFLRGVPKVPKVIHYCWFGKNPIPKHLQKCIDTWYKYCSDYEIIRWDESNYEISKNKYMLQAYEKKKYGFVPDYARLDIVRQYGGIYLDTDVELVRNLDDLLCYDFFCGFENEHFIALGLGFGAVAGHPLLSKLIDIYNELDFIKDGVINDVASPYYQSCVMEKEGFMLNDTYQEREGIGIFPHEVFAPGGNLLLPDGITENTFSVHHYDASWVEGREKQQKYREGLLRLYKERVLKREVD